MQIAAVQTSGIWGPVTPIPSDALGVLVSPSGYTVATPADYFSVLPDTVPGGIKNVFSGSLSLPADYFGMSFHRYPNGGTPTPTFEFSFARSHDYGPGNKRVRWSHIEPTQGVFDWSALDDFVDTHSAAGRKIIHTLFGSPTWASARPSEASSYGLGVAAEPANLANWDAYCSACATRYAGRIDYYEIWNEVNLAGFYTGTQTILAQMVRRANQVIKAIDPAAKIISPTTTSWQSGSGSSYFLAMMNASDGAAGTMKQWADAVGIHMYPDNSLGITTLPTMLTTVRANMATLGISALPLINTEYGMLSPEMQDIEDAEDRSSILARMLLLAAANNAGGASTSIWYDGDQDSNIGLSSVDWTNLAGIMRTLSSGPISVVNVLKDGTVCATINGQNLTFRV